jgi:hypothetical protein
MRFPALVLAVCSSLAFAPRLQAAETLHIDSPSENESVSGSVDIEGTAAVPGMTRFRVEFAYESNPTGTWFPITEGSAPVQDGLLAVWDTASISEGEYSLRLVAFLTDGSMREAVTHGIRVSRTAPLPAATPGETVIPVEGETQNIIRVPAAFPAPTYPGIARASSHLATTLPLTAFLAGAGAGLVLIGLWALRSRWLWWRHRLLVRSFRKRTRQRE